MVQLAIALVIQNWDRFYGAFANSLAEVDSSIHSGSEKSAPADNDNNS